MGKVEFAEHFKYRTKRILLEPLELFKDIKPTYDVLIIRNQLIRSASSVAANHRAACRARSRAEFFSKMSIVVEEADETLFWIELLEESRIVSNERIEGIKREALEILQVTAKARKTAKFHGASNKGRRN